MASLARACVGMVLVLVLPGVLVAVLLRMALRTIATWAAIPVFSLATVFLLSELTTVTGASFGVPAFLIMLLVLTGAALATRRRSGEVLHSREIDQSREPADESRRMECIARCLLVLGILVGAATWARGLADVPLLPPGADAARHGFMVGRIVHGQSVEVSRVLVYDADGAHRSFHYYPLAAHASAAIATRLGSADVGRVLVVFTVFFASVVQPLGMFVLARFLAPKAPLVAGFTALVTPSLTLFPYSAVHGGLVPLVVGMGMVPVSVALLARTVLSDDPPLRLTVRSLVALLPAALAVLAAISTHSSQVPLIVFLVLLLVLEQGWREHQPKQVLRALQRGLAVAVVVVFLFAPTLQHFLSGTSERSGSAPSLAADLTSLIKPTLTLGDLPGGHPERQVVLAGLALAGAGIWLLQRRFAWVVGWASVITLTVLAGGSDNRLVRELAFPWYRIARRIGWNQSFFVPFFAAVALAFVVSVIRRLLRARRGLIASTVVVVVLFTALIGLDAHRSARVLVRSSFTVDADNLFNQARTDHSSKAAFRWLGDHAGTNETVVNDSGGSSLWMYAQEGVKPLVGMGVFREKFVTPDWQDRVYLLQHIEALGNDERVNRLVDRYDARWIYVDERPFPLAQRELDVDALRENPHILQVFRRNSVHVFEVNFP